jgi:Transcriptional regulator SbtR-like, C-terminal domain
MPRSAVLRQAELTPQNDAWYTGHLVLVPAVKSPRTRILFSYSSDLLMRSAGGLLDRAIAAGAIRNEIGPEELIRTLAGMCYTYDRPGWQKSVLRLVDVFIEGLQSTRQTPTAPVVSVMERCEIRPMGAQWSLLHLIKLNLRRPIALAGGRPSDRGTRPAATPRLQQVRTFPRLPIPLAPAISGAPSMSPEDALQTPRPVFQRRAARSAANSHRSGPQASHSDASLQIDRVPQQLEFHRGD